MTSVHRVQRATVERYRPTPAHSAGTSAPRGNRISFRPDVEGLRGIAILLVVAYHVGLTGFGGGFVGVDVFFVLSGFLITALLFAELSREGTIDFAAFYARRVRRLLPAAATALIGTVAIAVVVYPPHQILSIAAAAQAAAAFGSNFFFAHQARDYFRSGGKSPLLHTWSLSVEEQFYLVWPLIVWLAAGRRANHRRLGWTLAAVVVASLVQCWYWTLAARPTAFYGTPMRAWEFAIGGTVALLPRLLAARAPGRRLASSVTAMAGWCGFGMIVGAAATFSERTTFPGVAAALPVVGTALVLAAGTGTGVASVGRVLSARVLQWVGRHSYSWYLWHWPMLVLGVELFPYGGTGTRAALALVGLVLAALTRVLVEDPVRHAPALARRPARVVAGGLAGLAILVLAGAALREQATRVSREPAYQAIRRAIADIPKLYDEHCSADFEDTTVHLCESGTRSGARATVLVFGDSHAAQLVPALEEIARERRWRILILTKQGCPSAAMSVYEPVFRRAYTECDAWRRAALDSVRAHPPTFVVIANSMEYVRGDPRGRPRATMSADEYERGLSGTLSELRGARVPAVVIQDFPAAPESVPLCLERSLWRGRSARSCDFRASEGHHEGAARAAARAVAAVPGDRVIDLTEALCPGGLCSAEREGVIVYRDDNHITTRAARLLAPALESALDASGVTAGS